MILVNHQDGTNRDLINKLNFFSYYIGSCISHLLDFSVIYLMEMHLNNLDKNSRDFKIFLCYIKFVFTEIEN